MGHFLMMGFFGFIAAAASFAVLFAACAVIEMASN